MIPIKNVYYMLAYAFQILQNDSYKNLSTEDFNSAAELYAAILEKGISIQIKRGLIKDYIDRSETLSTLRGKMDISASLKTQALIRRQMVCTYDDFSDNTKLNQILKTTLIVLLHNDIRSQQKRALRNLLLFFSDVDTIDLHLVNWNRAYNRNDQTYQMLLGICFLVYKGLLQSQETGDRKLMDFIDEQRMSHLYEKFILEYYRKEYGRRIKGFTANPSQIPWQLDNNDEDYLPIMQTDITLTYKKQILIIDAKYYQQSMQEKFNVRTIHSGNLYQIFTYVKNKEIELSGKEHQVAGMLLYAGTDEDLLPDKNYSMSGNQISVTTLDLNQDFSLITKQLNLIADRYFGIEQETRAASE